MSKCRICGIDTGETGNLECSKCFDAILKLNLVSSRDRPDVIFIEEQKEQIHKLSQGTVADFTQPKGCPDESFNKDLTGLSADKPQIEPNGSTSLNPDIICNFKNPLQRWEKLR